MRVRSGIYARATWRAPWGVAYAAFETPVFHILTTGDCWLEVEGESNQLQLVAGDLVVLPSGLRHWLRNARETSTIALEKILAEYPRDRYRRLRFGGNGAPTEMLCGRFVLEGRAAHPILRALPRMLLIRGIEGRPVPWLAATVKLLAAETTSEAPGAEAVLTRLADAMLAQALRVALAGLLPPAGGRLGARDTEIATAIELIHRHPDQRWTVGELAQAVALSRSAFSMRFRQLVGESPKRYLNRNLLARAAVLLARTDSSLAEIADETGYSNEFSFAKAFKRAFGVAPGAYRKGLDDADRTVPSSESTAEPSDSL